ncbi:MAG: flagellar biosynthesis protein FlhA [Bacillota bacterium]|nr:flagellar biosynthesis protein FlhA [Bacillota bacterium]
MKLMDVLISAVVLLIILLIIIPLSAGVLDVMLVINITTSVMILLVTLYSKEALQFSVFPPLLLIITLFRLSLNISSTRLILSNGGEAGKVIRTFGNFVIGGNVVVGVIIFLIITIIQFVVITKGSERVAEVAARFTLDAMPGKQMAIDADLNTGLINDTEARQRRAKVQREADFYGAMDGASKFVKGDAIVGIIIIVINIVGGIIIGVMTLGIPLSQVVQQYTLSTVGDGLVNQLPALLISTSTGIIVTRAASENNLGRDITKQLFSQPQVLIIAGGMIFLIGLIPGLPKIPIFVIAGLLAWLGYTMYNSKKVEKDTKEASLAEQAAQETRKPENVVSLLNVDPIELEFGYGLIPLADASQGGDLLDRVVMIRRQCAVDMGMLIPVIRLRDNIMHKANEYVIKIKGNEVARGEVYADHFLAMNPDATSVKLNGIQTVEPAFGLPAVWITKSERERAEVHGYTIVDPPSVIATHLTEVLKHYGYELLGRQQVQTLLDNLKQTQPALVDEVTPKLFSLGEIQKVLANLLRENVSIRDMATILETMADYSTYTHDPDLLTEYVRQKLKRTISNKFIPSGKARVITISTQLEDMIAENIHKSEQGSYVVLEPEYLQKLASAVKAACEKFASIGITPIVLTSSMVRRFFKKLVEPIIPDLVVLSYNEVDSDIELQSDDKIGI